MMNKLFSNNPWARMAAFFFAMVTALVVASCGGNGAGAGGSGAAVATKAASLALLTSETSLGSDGRTSATLTAVVKNNLNVALSGEQVIFSTTDSGAILEVKDSVTSASGRASAELTISDTSVRNIVVTASSGTIVQNISIPVVGTVLSISGSSTIVFNSATQFSLTLRDSSGNPISGASVAVSSGNANEVAPSSVTTDAQGQASFNVTGRVAGADNLSATAQGVTSTFPVTVSSTSLTFQAPNNQQEIDVNTASTVSVQLIQNGSPIGGQLIQFSATRGSFVGNSSATTDGSGLATVQVQSTSSGVSTLTATSPSGTTSTRQFEFVSRTPTKLNLQPSPAIIGVNLDTAGTNASQLIAVAKDANDNPVKGVRVDFTSLADPSNGRIEPSFGITDSFGTATASFIAGPNPTGPNQVQLRARLQAFPSVISDASLTVSRLELSVEIGTGNTITATDTTYTMPWTALVADSTGNPIQNALVTASIVPTGYRKGNWVDVADRWSPLLTNPFCPSEDANNNGRLERYEDLDNDGVFDPGEDLNGDTVFTPSEDTDHDGQLEPGYQGVISVTTESSRTTASGLASMDLTYPKSAGFWTQMRIEVTITTTSGTEQLGTETFWLPILGDDINSTQKAPPGANAPIGLFGENASCANPT